MTIKLVHGLVAAVTVLLLLLHRKLYQIKEKTMANKQCSQETCGVKDVDNAVFSKVNKAVCFLVTSPKYKRDPDIAVDNEFIGQKPLDRKAQPKRRRTK